MILTEYYGPKTNPVNNEIIGDFVSHVMFGEKGMLSNYCSMAVVKGGDLIAGVIYNEYFAGSKTIEISAASIDKRWMTRKVIHDMFFLPFERLGSHLVVVKTSEKNVTVRKISERCGLKPYYIPDMRGPGEGEYTYTMTKELWRSLPFSEVRHENT